MYIVVVGGGEVGYYLTKELLEANHEVVLMEKNKSRAEQISEELGSMVIAKDGCEGRYMMEAGAFRADMVIAVTGDDEDNLVICQMAKYLFNVPRTIARVSNPKNEVIFAKLGIDETVSSTRRILRLIEEELPAHHLAQVIPIEPGGIELVEVVLEPNSPITGKAVKEVLLPPGSLFSLIVRNGEALLPSPETVFLSEDKVLVITSPEYEDKLRGALVG